MTEEYKVPDGMVGFSKYLTTVLHYSEGFLADAVNANIFLYFLSPSHWQRWRADFTHTARVRM